MDVGIDVGDSASASAAYATNLTLYIIIYIIPAAPSTAGIIAL